MKSVGRVDLQSQQGTATIMLIVMLPVLLGFFALGVEGSRYIRVRVQLDDAAEVASLALSARGSQDQSANEALAKAYIETLVPDAKDVTVTVARRECKDIADCGTPGVHDEKGFHFNEYRVSATTRHDSWLPSLGHSGLAFDPEVSLASTAVSRKFQGTAIDVVFVADFSGSMSLNWNGEKKISQLKDVVEDIAKEVIAYSETWQEKNKVALVPFTNQTYEKKESVYCSVRQYTHSADNTVSSLFVEKECISTEDQDFYTVALTNNGNEFTNSLISMKAKSFWSCIRGCTASFEGIIRGAQIASDGENP